MSNDEDVYRVDTVPPPDGEGDAYNAPTRVGAGPPTEVLADMKAAAATGRPLKPKALPVAVPSPPTDLPGPTEVDAARVGEAKGPAETVVAGSTPSMATEEVPLARAVTWTFAALALIAGAYALVGR